MIKFGKEALICGQAEAEGSKIMNKTTFFTCSTHAPAVENWKPINHNVSLMITSLCFMPF